MNSFSKTFLLSAIMAVALQPNRACAETGSASSSTTSTPDQKTHAKSGDQPAAKDSGAAARSESSKKVPVYSKAEPASPHAVVALQGPELFKVLDTDKDGRISSAEFIAYGTASDARPSESAKTAPDTNARREPSPAPATSGASSKSEPAKPAPADTSPVAVPELSSPSTDIPTGTSTRAGRYNAEMFELLDINHDKFLVQAELDALFGAHHISQP